MTTPMAAPGCGHLLCSPGVSLAGTPACLPACLAPESHAPLPACLTCCPVPAPRPPARLQARTIEKYELEIKRRNDEIEKKTREIDILNRKWVLLLGVLRLHVPYGLCMGGERSAAPRAVLVLCSVVTVL